MRPCPGNVIFQGRLGSMDKKSMGDHSLKTSCPMAGMTACQDPGTLYLNLQTGRFQYLLEGSQ